MHMSYKTFVLRKHLRQVIALRVKKNVNVFLNFFFNFSIKFIVVLSNFANLLKGFLISFNKFGDLYCSEYLDNL